MHAVDFHLKHLGHHLCDLDIQALAHFCAAVVQVNAAIGVNVYQRSGLVEKAGSERNAEFDRGEGQAFFQDRAADIEGLDRCTALRVLAAGFEIGGHFMEQVVLHGLVIVSHVALGFAVVIDLAHRQRVQVQMPGNPVHDLLNGDHALRAAEAAIRRIGGRVGFAAVPMDCGIAQVIRVVGVKHGAVNNGP